MKWISIDEAMPEVKNLEEWNPFERLKVLVWDGNEWEESGYDPFDKVFYDLSDYPGYKIEGVTHWAIPELPEGARQP